MELLFEVKDLEETIRLDNYLREQLRSKGINYGLLKSKLETEGILVNGRNVRKKSWLLKNGDKIEIRGIIPQKKFVPIPQSSIPLDIIYEDEAILAVEKKHGQPIYPLKQEENDTLANVLISHYPFLSKISSQPQQTGIIYRLDIETSGIVLVAKTGNVFNSLFRASKNGHIRKEYFALVWGHMPNPEKITWPIATKGRYREKVTVLKNSNYNQNDFHSIQNAETFIEPIKKLKGVSLIKAIINTGRRHQIRAHLSAAGFPIIGDPLYCEWPVPEDLNRLFLHLTRVIFPHPLTGKQIRIKLPLTKELHNFWEKIKNNKTALQNLLLSSHNINNKNE